MRFLLTLMALGGALVPGARPEDPRTIDRQVSDGLREVHDRGADLYNAGDTAAGYRMYQGGLILAKTALAHRPEVQKVITDGMIAAERQPSIARRAFLLHELIEQVRGELRGEAKKAPEAPPGKKPAGEHLTVPPRVVDPSKSGTKPETKTDTKPKAETKTDTKPKTEAKPPEKVEKKPETKTDPKPGPKPSGTVAEVKDGVIGRVLWQNNPVSGVEVTFVTLGRQPPRVYESVTGAQGVYTVPGLAAGKYVILVTPGPKAEVKKLPDRYATATTSPLVFDVKGGGEKVDLVLQ